MTREPIRLQLSRRKGFNLQAESMAVNGLPAAKVDRATWCGNHIKLGGSILMKYEDGQYLQLAAPISTAAEAVVWFKATWDAFDARHPGGSARWFNRLRGKNLACWCKIGDPCHADVLIEIANRPVCEEA